MMVVGHSDHRRDGFYQMQMAFELGFFFNGDRGDVQVETGPLDDMLGNLERRPAAEGVEFVFAQIEPVATERQDPGFVMHGHGINESSITVEDDCSVFHGVKDHFQGVVVGPEEQSGSRIYGRSPR